MKWAGTRNIFFFLLGLIVNVNAKTDAKTTIDNSETEKHMQTCWRTNFKQFGFSFQKKVTPPHLIPICFAYKTWMLVN